MGVQKNIFPEMGAGGVQIKRCFTEQIFSVKKVVKTARKSLFLFRKVSPAFLEHSLFLLVFKQITDVAFQKAAKGVEVIPSNSLSLSQLLDSGFRQELFFAQSVGRIALFFERIQNIDLIFQCHFITSSNYDFSP
jgi:hypothetical protein